MSVLIEPNTQSGLFTIARAAGAKVALRLKAFAVSVTRRKQVEAMSRLDDRMLADIGVTRADLEEAARWSLWGDPGDRLAEISEERRAARSRLG